MTPNPSRPANKPVIVKTSVAERVGIHSFETSRCMIGYVLGGYKYIYNGDERSLVMPGDLFFLNKGIHFLEDIPEERKAFEQITFFYTPGQLGHIISLLSRNLHTDVRVGHTCDECRGRDHIIMSGMETMKHFFNAVGHHLKDGLYARDSNAEFLKLMELIYYIVSLPDCCIRTRVLGSTDPEKEFFERSVHDYIFSDMTLEELARNNNRSLTSFKKAFKNYFNDPPHRWVVRQRLMHSRLLLISTNKSIALIGAECRFPNTSHFIKLFRKEFGMTPADYRRKYSNDLSKRVRQLSTKPAKIEA